MPTGVRHERRSLAPGNAHSPGGVGDAVEQHPSDLIPKYCSINGKRRSTAVDQSISSSDQDAGLGIHTLS